MKGRFKKIKLENFIWLLVFLVPFYPYVNFPGFDVSVLRVGLLLLASVLAIYLSRKEKGLRISSPLFFISLFLLWSLFSVFWSDSCLGALKKFVLLANFLTPLILFGIWFSGDRKKMAFWLARAISWSAVGVGLIGVGQFLAQFIFSPQLIFKFWTTTITLFFAGTSLGSLVVDYPSWFFNFGGISLMRAVSIFPDPHILAFFVGMGALISIGLFVANKKKFFLINFLFLSMVLFLTFSRGGYLGFLVGLLVFICLYWTRAGINFKKWFFIILIIVLASAFIYQNVFVTRLLSSFDLSEGSNVGRLSLWAQSLDLFRQEPLWGHGLASYAPLIAPSVIGASPITTHNLYLDILVDLGLIGLFLFLAGCFYSLRALFKKAKREPLFLGFLAAFVYFLIHSFFEIGIFNPATFFVFTALILSADGSG